MNTQRDVTIIPEGADVFSLHYAKRERLPMWVVTKSPSDFPGKFVARLHYTLPAAEPTKVVIIGDTIEAVREAIPHGLFAFARYPSDDPVIVETWM